MARGSVTKVPTGYRARWRTPDGASRSRTFPLGKKAEAEKWLAEKESEKSQGRYLDPSAGRVLLSEYAETWAMTRPHRQSTAARVASDLRVHVLPKLGHRPLGQLRHSEVQGLVTSLSAALAPGTVENVYRTLSAICHTAVRDRLIAANPCEGVTLPRRTRVEVEPPTIDEVLLLLDAMPARYRIAGVLAAGAGLRQGEALGVTVDRIDFLRRRLRIDRQLVTPPHGEPHLAPTKTEASVRTVALAEAVVEPLAAHLAEFSAGPHGLVLTYVDGRPVRRNRFGAMWRQTLQRAGLDNRFHHLRHHFASVLIAGGCSVKVVQKTLGHASARETLDTYGHLWPDSEDLTRQAVDAAFRGAGRAPDIAAGGVAGQ